MKINNFLPIFFYSILILVVFRFLFLPIAVTGGDYFTLTHQQLSNWRSFSFTSWDTMINLGWNSLPLIHYGIYGVVIGYIGLLFADNSLVVERLVWWIPFFVI